MAHYRKLLFFIIASIIVSGITSGCASYPFSGKSSGEKNGGEERTPELERVIIKGIETDLAGEEKIVRIEASAPFKYITYMLKKPRRLAVEISGAESALRTSSIMVDDNVIKHIGALDFVEAGAVRVEIWLTRPMKYSTTIENSELSIRLTPYAEENDPAVMAERLILTHQTVDRLRAEVEELQAQLEEAQSQRNKDENRIADLMEKLSSISMARKIPDAAGGIAPHKTDVAKQREEAASPEKSVDNDRVEITEVIGKWKSAWQDRDYEAYAGFYAGTFLKKDMGLEEWLAVKRRKFRKAKNISVKIKNLNIVVDGDRARVKFTQLYSSERYNDKGVKTIMVVKTGEGWKIESENWIP